MIGFTLSVKSCQFPLASQSLLAFVVNSLPLGLLQLLTVRSKRRGGDFHQHFRMWPFGG